MANVMIVSTRLVEAMFELPADWALTVEIGGRGYVGVRRADDNPLVQVVYWPDETGDDNVTLTPPGVPVPPGG